MKIFLSITLVLCGVAIGLAIDQANNRRLVTKAETACHNRCDKSNPEEIGNLICKSQCTRIIVDSQCLKFPNQ